MMSPIMASGLLDCLGFIGTNAAADALQKAHPAPHRLRVCLGLDAKVWAPTVPVFSACIASDIHMDHR